MKDAFFFANTYFHCITNLLWWVLWDTRKQESRTIAFFFHLQLGLLLRQKQICSPYIPSKSYQHDVITWSFSLNSLAGSEWEKLKWANSIQNGGMCKGFFKPPHLLYFCVKRQVLSFMLLAWISLSRSPSVGFLWGFFLFLPAGIFLLAMLAPLYNKESWRNLARKLRTLILHLLFSFLYT